MRTGSQNPLVARATTIIEQRTGLAVGEQFRANLETILEDLAQGDLAGLVRTLHDTPETAPAWQKLMAALAIGETYFFRHKAHFELFRNYILPTLIAQRRRQALNLAIWSAGCSTGEEPYSIAIMLREYLPDLPRWNLRLIGSDLNFYALQAAQTGIYRRWAFRMTDRAFQQQYFTPAAGGLQISQSIRSLVTFHHANLLAGPPAPQLDIIFCCNVLIYFEDKAIRRVEEIFHEALAPGGWLIQTEMLRFRRERWTTHVFPGAVMYQKPASAACGTGPLHHLQPAPDLKPSPAVQSPAPAIYAEAVAALRDQDYTQAERLLVDILSQTPGYAPAHVLLGCIFANRQALPEAQMHLDTALRLDSLQADAHYLKGMILLEVGQTLAARQALRAALYCRRDHVLAALALGHLYIQAGEHGRARRTWEEALRRVRGLLPHTPVSDLSDLTAAAASALLAGNLKGLPA